MSIFENIHTSREDIELIFKIAKRFKNAMDNCGPAIFTVTMDLEAVHADQPLNLAQMVEGNEQDICHDIGLINRNLNRETGKLENGAVPRFSRQVTNVSTDDSFEFVCPCGNTAEIDGFFPCTPGGAVIEPEPDNWDGHYVCDSCQRIYFNNHRSDEYEAADDETGMWDSEQMVIGNV